MNGKRVDRLARHLDGVLGLGVVGHVPDSTLIDRFVEGDEPVGGQAFAALVDRHGPMVLAACRSVLREEHDARDAFQATFLVLARKAGALRVKGSIGPWLHVVAVRAARTAWANSRRRKGHEQAAAERTRDRVDPGQGLGLDAEVVHEEISRLPERFRGPILLCELEGLPVQHAADSLGCAVGTIKSRLSRGRTILRDRLAARGLDPARALGMAVGLGRVPVPAELGGELIRAAGLVRAGLGLAAGIVPAAAIETTTSVLGNLAMFKMKALLLASVMSALIVAGSFVGRTQDAAAGRKDDPPAAEGDAARLQSEVLRLADRIRQLEAAATAEPVAPWTPPASPSDPPKVAAVSDGPGGSARPDSVKAHVIRDIEVDGDLGDWPPAIPRHPLKRVLDFGIFEGNIQPGGNRNADLSTHPDISAAFSVGYDPGRQLVHVAVIVRDDRTVVGHDHFYDTDSVELYFDGLHGERAVPEIGGTLDKAKLKDLPVQQYIGIPGTGPVYGVKSAGNPMLIGGDLGKTKTRMAYRRQGDVITYEWAVQVFDRYPDAPTRLAPGKRIGFDLAVVDKDPDPADGVTSRPAPLTWIYWGPEWHGVKAFDAGALGEIVLGR